ncbi:hypothetical protein ACFL1N_17835 [Thermodesulfobacteriota bacterium]
MNKYLYILIMFLLSCLFVSTAYGSNPEVVIKESNCTKEGVIVKYGFINHEKYDRPNITVVFKILEGGKAIGCTEINTTIPRNSDGSKIEEVLIDAPCAGKKTGITYRIYLGGSAKYTIESYKSDCP